MGSDGLTLGDCLVVERYDLAAFLLVSATLAVLEEMTPAERTVVWANGPADGGERPVPTRTPGRMGFMPAF